ncbi:MAG: dCTP deaminase, partial [Dokdonia sp.]
MILSGKEIKRQLGTGINIQPFNDSQLNPNSYNLSLFEELLTYDNPILDMKTPNPTTRL